MKFVHYKQFDSMDYGLTCLRMVAKYYGKSYSLQYLRNNSFITREEVSMLGFSESAEQIGFRTRGYCLNWEQLRDEVPFCFYSATNTVHYRNKSTIFSKN